MTYIIFYGLREVNMYEMHPGARRGLGASPEAEPLPSNDGGSTPASESESSECADPSGVSDRSARSINIADRGRTTAWYRYV
eukprot:SAG11_NODE_358_length_10235_cov_5.689917_2_plen_82_part_00